jgi:nitrate/nitrite-specific signal transduction histidine kinase
MTERAQRLGARLEVLSTPARGTSVVLTCRRPQSGHAIAAAGRSPRRPADA